MITPVSGSLTAPNSGVIGGSSTGTSNDEYWVLAQEAYARATELAASLRPSHPVRLSIALNLSIFYYETMRSEDKALHLARQAFTAAIMDETAPETILESEANEAGSILRLLQENLYFWTNPNTNTD
jgi:14-3-3 protein epsilon